VGGDGTVIPYSLVWFIFRDLIGFQILLVYIFKKLFFCGFYPGVPPIGGVGGFDKGET